jgi:hypothetical protein
MNTDETRIKTENRDQQATPACSDFCLLTSSSLIRVPSVFIRGYVFCPLILS